MFGKRQSHHELVAARRSVICYPDASALTWSCHVCSEERPDRFISVFSREVVFAQGVRARTNVRYCNDRAECIAGAPTINFGLD